MISIVVPVYKSEKTLHRCVDSLLRQTYKDIQVLLVVDGSPDSSFEICEEYEAKDSRVRAIFRNNEGVSAARNCGVREAKGEYIMFVDSDDYIEANTCDHMLKILKKNQADLVIAGFHHVYLGRDVKKTPKHSGTFTKEQFGDQFLSLYEDGFLNMPWNKLFKKELITEGFPTDLNLGEDLIFNLRYLRNANRISVTKELFCYYIQEASKNTLSTKRRANKADIAYKVAEETRNFYLGMVGKQVDTTRIDAKYVKEFLDEVMELAFDDSMNEARKKELIYRYASHPYMRRVNPSNGPDRLPLPGLDYRLVNHYFRKGRVHWVLLLINLRKIVVLIVRGIRG